LFLKDCVECELKRGKAKKGIVVKPILSQEQNSRCQVDLIDLQSCPVEGFNHIMVYQVIKIFVNKIRYVQYLGSSNKVHRFEGTQTEDGVGSGGTIKRDFRHLWCPAYSSVG
jgi:hypothetical protein